MYYIGKIQDRRIEFWITLYKLFEENAFRHLSIIFCFDIVLMPPFINFTLQFILFAVEPFHSYKWIDKEDLNPECQFIKRLSKCVEFHLQDVAFPSCAPWAYQQCQIQDGENTQGSCIYNEEKHYLVNGINSVRLFGAIQTTSNTIITSRFSSEQLHHLRWSLTEDLQRVVSCKRKTEKDSEKKKRGSCKFHIFVCLLFLLYLQYI